MIILASGNVVHNLRRIQWDKPDLAYDWAERFDDAAAEQLARDSGRHPQAGRSIQITRWRCRRRTISFRLLYLAGLRRGGRERPETAGARLLRWGPSR